MSVSVLDASTFDLDGDSIARFARAVLSAEGVEDDADLTIRFVGDSEITELNEAHMGKAGPTDVLSFPIEDALPGHPPTSTPGGPPLDLGDILIATDVVRQHADQFEVGFLDELHLMVCHGILHILGWDHITDEDAEAMESRESQHLSAIGMVRR